MNELESARVMLDNKLDTITKYLENELELEKIKVKVSLNSTKVLCLISCILQNMAHPFSYKRRKRSVIGGNDVIVVEEVLDGIAKFREVLSELPDLFELALDDYKCKNKTKKDMNLSPMNESDTFTYLPMEDQDYSLLNDEEVLNVDKATDRPLPTENPNDTAVEGADTTISHDKNIDEMWAVKNIGRKNNFPNSVDPKKAGKNPGFNPNPYGQTKVVKNPLSPKKAIKNHHYNGIKERMKRGKDGYEAVKKPVKGHKQKASGHGGSGNGSVLW